MARRLGTGDAVVIGLGSMIGAGVFAAFSPAARAGGAGLLIGLALAAGSPTATRPFQRNWPRSTKASGGTCVYGRERLGPGRYDVVANLAAFTQSADRRRWPRALQVVGAAGCLVLVATLPLTAVVTGASVFAVGAIYRAVRLRVSDWRRPRSGDRPDGPAPPPVARHVMMRA